MQPTFISRATSMAGAALVGLVFFIFYENLDEAATQMKHLLGAIPGHALGMLPTVIRVAWRVWQACTGDHQCFLQGFLRHLLVTSWPLLLIAPGTALSRNAPTDHAGDKRPSKKDCDLVDLAAGRSTLK